MNKHCILVLGPHTDDGELGCGASMVKWLEKGSIVYYVAFSAAEASVPEHLPNDILRTEIREASHRIGIKQDYLKVLHYPVRYFHRDRQDILETLISLRGEINPDLIVVPCSYDTHQDHEIIHQESFRAFKHATILGYEIPWNIRKIDLTFFNVIDASHLQAKIDALMAYKSQYFRMPNLPELIKSLALHRGYQIGKTYAEAFEVIRWVEN